MPYFHVVFTMPAPIAAIALQNKAVVYDMLFEAAAETVRTIAADPKHLGAEIGMIAVLHTWGSTLTHHPHVHCIVPGGGLAPDGALGGLPAGLLPAGARAVASVPPAVPGAAARPRIDSGALQFFGEHAPRSPSRARSPNACAPLRQVEWVVYAKRPFAGPQAVLDYLAATPTGWRSPTAGCSRSTSGGVSFRWKDYRAKGRTRSKVMTLVAERVHAPLPAARAARRLPPDPSLRLPGQRPSHRPARRHPRSARRARTAVDAPPSDYRERYALLTGRPLDICPCCGGAMIEIATFARARPSSTPIWCDSS